LKKIQKKKKSYLPPKKKKTPAFQKIKDDFGVIFEKNYVVNIKQKKKKK